MLDLHYLCQDLYKVSKKWLTFKWINVKWQIWPECNINQVVLQIYLKYAAGGAKSKTEPCKIIVQKVFCFVVEKYDNRACQFRSTKWNAFGWLRLLCHCVWLVTVFSFHFNFCLCLSHSY